MAQPSGFAPGVTEKLKYYVYLLIDPVSDEVFYVGKGTGDRCFAHLDEACKSKAKKSKEFGRLDRIRAIEKKGYEVRIEVLRHGMDEPTAFAVEAAAIDLLGLNDLLNVVTGTHAADVGRMSITDLNSKYAAAPVTIDPSHRVVLIRINQKFHLAMTPDELYEATRKWWKIGAPRRQLGAPAAPEWAFSVFGGIVRAVYRIKDWHEADAKAIAEHETRAGRWGFTGVEDPDLESQYRGRSVADHLLGAKSQKPTQNPIRYVNCK